MVGEYRVMGIYPRGHPMEFVRPGLGKACSPRWMGRVSKMAQWLRWPVGRWQDSTLTDGTGTVFVTIEDETGDVEVIIWRDLFARRRRELGRQVVEVTGRVSRWHGTTNVIATDLWVVRSGVVMPSSH